MATINFLIKCLIIKAVSYCGRDHIFAKHGFQYFASSSHSHFENDSLTQHSGGEKL